MTRTIFCTLFLLGLVLTLHAQSNITFGNEWIRYGQPYYKMQVAEDGIYRIDHQTLQQVGINTQQIQAAQWQIFHNGVEIPLYVASSAGSLHYIEFYAEKQKGDFDSLLYDNAVNQLNPDYSLITDTAAYFLTWTTTANGLRYQQRLADLNNLPAKENYYLHRQRLSFKNQWQEGTEYPIGTAIISKSTFECGEGWGTNLSQQQQLNFQISEVYAGGPQAQGAIRIYSKGSGAHQLQLSTLGNSLLNYSFSGDSIATYTFPFSAFAAGNISLNVLGAAGVNDLHSIAYAEITYPRRFNFDGASVYSFEIAGGTQRKFLEITNFYNPNNLQEIFLYDFETRERIQCLWNNGKVYVDISASSQAHRLLLVNMSAPGAYRPINLQAAHYFTDYRQWNADYVLLAASKLFRDAAGNNPVLDYAAYRSSTGYQPAMIDVQEVFDQFGYGVNMHPQSIRNFVSFISTYWPNAKQVFLLGKAREYPTVRNAYTYDHLLPSFGYPASDALLFATRGNNRPRLAFGRLAVTDAEQLSAYLQKIRQMEQAQKDTRNAAFTKKVLHWSGGANEYEEFYFKQLLQDLSPKIENFGFGAEVQAFSPFHEKQNQVPTSVAMDSLLRKGVGLITYLGHGATDNIEFNASNLDFCPNNSKFPVFLSLACYNGYISGSEPQMSERIVLNPSCGASVAVGFTGSIPVTPTFYYADVLYELIAAGGHEQNFGTLHHSALQRLSDQSAYNWLSEMALHSLTYHGDPAFRLSYKSRPDYYIDSNALARTALELSTNTDDLTLNFKLYNGGLAVDSMLNISVYGQDANGQSALLKNIEVKAPKTVENIELSLPMNKSLRAQLQRLRIRVDAAEKIAESEENNNDAFVNLTRNNIRSTAYFYPQEFAIVGDSLFSLQAMVSGSDFCRIQIDNSPLFNSPALLEENVAVENGFVFWQPAIEWQDSSLYFWRILLPDSTSADYSSFYYLKGQSGWHQSHSAQFVKNELNGLQALPQLDFDANVEELFLQNAFSTAMPFADFNAIYFNANLVEKCRCNNERGVIINVIEPETGVFKTFSASTAANTALYCGTTGGTSPNFLFETDKLSGQQALVDFLRDSIPAGHYVLAYTLNNAFAEHWSNALLQAFQQQGATRVTDLAARIGGSPWAFFFRKDEPNFPYMQEALANSSNDYLRLSCRMDNKWHQGQMLSTKIGPVKSWSEFSWHYDGQLEDSDSASVDVYGLDALGNSRLLFGGLNSGTFSLAAVNADSFPYLQLLWTVEDSINKSIVPLQVWQIKGAMMPDLLLKTNQQGLDTILQGHSPQWRILAHNIADSDSDSIWVKYYLEGQNPSYIQLAAIEGKDSLLLPALQLNTATVSGLQTLTLEINADRTQLETHYYNNVLQLNFVVQSQESVNEWNLSLEAGAEKAAIAVLPYPNPFREYLRFRFSSNVVLEDARLEIYSLSGQLLKAFNRQDLGIIEAGVQESNISWDGRDAQGAMLPAGIYFYRLMNKEKPMSSGQVELLP